MWTATSLRRALDARGLRPRKGLGQHFLIDPNFCRFIVRAADLPPAAHVLEIGPGPGLLTVHLAPACARLTAVEIDPAMAALCREAVGDLTHVEILIQDILDLNGKIANLPRASGGTENEGDPEPFAVAQGKLRRNTSALNAAEVEGLHVFGNLPYNRSVNILIALLAWERPFPQALLLVQREVGEKLRARPGTEYYGPLSVVAQAFATIERVRAVPRTVFRPAPRVGSELVRLSPSSSLPAFQPTPPRPAIPVVWDFLQRLFQSRRKRLANALGATGLSSEAVAGACAAAGVSPDDRAEALPPGALVELARAARVH